MLFADDDDDDATSTTSSIHTANSRMLASMQQEELQACRDSLDESLQAIVAPSSSTTAAAAAHPHRNGAGAGTHRSSTIFPMGDDDRVFVHDHHSNNEESSASSRPSTPSSSSSSTSARTTATTYSCHVLSLGGRHDSLRFPNNNSNVSIARLACATHHTLCLSVTGTVYAMGHGKGGRLGTGNEHAQLRPVPIFHHAVAIAAGPTHSLLVQGGGTCYAWGANGWGQTGLPAASAVPQRVVALPSTVRIRAIAAGDRHSVACSTTGQLYSWGDNRAGQLGIYNSYGQSGCPVRPVPHQPHTMRQITAAAVATVAVTDHGVVYGWGHGHAVPLKVVLARQQRHVQCGPYHTVAVDDAGSVTTWGWWHAVGRKRSTPTPERIQHVPPVAAVACAEHQTVLVTRTGRVYAVGGGHPPPPSAAAAQDTATTDEDVTTTTATAAAAAACWRPEPQRVPGILRAVAVEAVAQERTAVLVATTHPGLVYNNNDENDSLAERAARVVMENVDISNVVKVMIMAERISCDSLKEYCSQFVQSNMDLVLWKGAQKSELDTYLGEQIREKVPDAPVSLLERVVLAGSLRRGGELCSFDDWTTACVGLLEEDQELAKLCDDFVFEQQHLLDNERTHRQRRSKSTDGDEALAKQRSDSVYCSQRCDTLLSSLDVLSKDGAKATLAALTKEVRAIRKRLGQIDILSQLDAADLTAEQIRKMERKSLLESDMEKLLPAVELIEGVIRDFVGSDDTEADGVAPENQAVLEDTTPTQGCRQSTIEEDQSPAKEVADTKSFATKQTLRCNVCQIVCPDNRSLELHFNGRKHRNRVAQVAEEEQKSAAKSLLLEQQKSALLAPVPRAATTKKAPPNPWHAREAPTSKAPKFKLPPPPHPVGELSNSSPSSKNPDLGLRLPSGSASTMQTLPWASAPVVILESQSPKKGPSQKSLQEIMAEEEATRSKPKLRSSSKRFVAGLKTPETKRQECGRGGPTLGAFLPVSSSASSTPGKTGWSTPSSGAQQVSFREIQKEENDFQADHSYAKSSGTWFIERKERAGSFNAIQEQETAAREHERMVAEQIEIERQIYQQLQQEAKEKSTNMTTKTTKKPRSRRKSSKPKEHPNRNNGRTNSGSRDDSVHPNRNNGRTNSGSRDDSVHTSKTEGKS